MKGNEAAWMQKALLRTIDFYTNGPRGTLTWVLILPNYHHFPVPPDAVTCTSKNSYMSFAGRSWSKTNESTTVLVQLLIS